MLLQQNALQWHLPSVAVTMAPPCEEVLGADDVPGQRVGVEPWHWQPTKQSCERHRGEHPVLSQLSIRKWFHFCVKSPFSWCCTVWVWKCRRQALLRVQPGLRSCPWMSWWGKPVLEWGWDGERIHKENRQISGFLHFFYNITIDALPIQGKFRKPDCVLQQMMITALYIWSRVTHFPGKLKCALTEQPVRVLQTFLSIV